MAQSETQKKSVDRRDFMRGALKGAGGACLLAMGLTALGSVTARGKAATALRPPGALAEEDFLAACSRCGLCVRDCPYDTLKLADWDGEAALGTPYFTAREIPCEMCEDIPCVAACPTGALDKDLDDIDEARMGLAVLIDKETCLNMLGLRCDVCYRVCPVIDKAITLERRHNLRTNAHAVFEPVVHSEACTGCGKCERSCVLEEAAIKVLPVALAKGQIGGHYRLGWEEEAKKGGKVLEREIIDLPDRGYAGSPTLKGFKP